MDKEPIPFKPKPQEGAPQSGESGSAVKPVLSTRGVREERSRQMEEAAREARKAAKEDSTRRNKFRMKQRMREEPGESSVPKMDTTPIRQAQEKRRRDMLKRRLEENTKKIEPQ